MGVPECGPIGYFDLSHHVGIVGVISQEGLLSAVPRPHTPTEVRRRFQRVQVESLIEAA